MDLLSKRGQDRGKRFTYTKDLESITRIIHRDDVITALYGYGKGEEIEDEEGNPTGGFGRRINFSEINNGKAYVENNDAREMWGRNDGNGNNVHVFGKVEFDDCEDKEELLDLTIAKLEELSQPLITYQAKVIDLKAFGFEHEGVELGDTVTVIDKEFTPELRIRARVVKIVRDLLEPENNDITLGNFMPNITDTWNKQEQFINNFRGKQGVWDRSNIINSDGTISTNYLDGAINVLKTKLLASESGWYTDDSGNIVFENADKTSAMMLTGEGFMIANTKLPNGEYNWRAFGTGSGFTAEEIVAGILKGGKVKFDLENGTFLIGEDTEDYVLWFDGTNLRINLGGRSLEDSLQDIQDEIDQGKIIRSDEEPEGEFDEGQIWLHIGIEPNEFFILHDGEWVSIGTNLDGVYESIGDLQDAIGDISGELETKASDSILQQLQNEFETRNEQIEEDKQITEESISDLLSRMTGFDAFMGDKAVLWDFIEKSIRFSEEGIFVSDETGNMGVLIGDSKISFIDNGVEVAHIAGQTMQINHGIFVKSATIGKHKIETLPDSDITVFTYVGGDN